MGVFTRPSVCTSDGQREMNKEGDSPDCEFLWRLRDCEARSNRLLQKKQAPDGGTGASAGIWRTPQMSMEGDSPDCGAERPGDVRLAQTEAERRFLWRLRSKEQSAFTKRQAPDGGTG